MKPHEHEGLVKAIRERVRGASMRSAAVETIESMTPAQRLDHYLRWNGIIGWTDDILIVLGLNPDGSSQSNPPA